MKLTRRLRGLRKGELGGLAADSSYVAAWQGATALADFAQIALISHVLGIEEFGAFAIVVSFVLLVDQFFDVRVGVAATTVGAQELRHDTNRAAGVFQLSYAIDLISGVFAFLLVAGLAFPIAPLLVEDDAVAIALAYALSLLAGTLDDSSLAVLRLLERYRLVAGYTVALEGIRVALVAVAVLALGSLVAVAGALALYRLLGTLVAVSAARAAFAKAFGRPLFARGRLADVSDLRRPMLKTVLNTNVVSYGRIAQTQLPTLVLGSIAGPLQAGIYKLGMALGAGIGKLADPPYIALLPRLSRLFAAGDRAGTRRMIRRISRASIPAAVAVLAVLIVLAGPLLSLVGGYSGTEGRWVLAIGGAAFAINAAFFWNVAIVFAAGRSGVVAATALAVAAVQAALLFPLIEALDAKGAAIAFLISMIVANVVLTKIALRELKPESA